MSVPSPDAILHLATLHLLSQAGFASTSQAASLSLTSVVAQYFKLIARSSIDRALLAGRNKPGALDVVESLKDLGYGFGLDELYEHGLDHSGSTLEGDGLALLSEYLDQGRALDEPLAELKLVSREEAEELGLDENEDVDPGSPDSPGAKDEPMEVDVDVGAQRQVEDRKPDVGVSMERRPWSRSPDYSWLPPRPDAREASESKLQVDPAQRMDIASRDDNLAEPATAPTSIAERYRMRIPFSASSLSSQAIYESPFAPSPSTRRSIAIPPTSLPHLIQTYSDTRNELSVAIRPNGFRLQALDLLRRQIAAPDNYGPDDSLAAPNVVPGPKVSPISVPAHPVSINPSQQGILSQLVHSIHSANLPPELRERLTSLRPPLAQKRDGQSLTYGPGMRGADQAALLKNQGKQPEEKDEQYAFATWDSGPRGQEKFSRGVLPKGKKVIKYVEGDEFPRQAEKRKSIDIGMGGESAPKTTLRLKLGDSVSPAPPSSSGQDGQASTSEPPLATPGGTTIKLRVPGSQEPRTASPVPPQSPAEPLVEDGAGSEHRPSLRISLRSPIPPASGGVEKTEQISLTPTRGPISVLADQPGEVNVNEIDRKPALATLDALPDLAVRDTSIGETPLAPENGAGHQYRTTGSI